MHGVTSLVSSRKRMWWYECTSHHLIYQHDLYLSEFQQQFVQLVLMTQISFTFAFSRHKSRSPAFELCSTCVGGRRHRAWFSGAWCPHVHSRICTGQAGASHSLQPEAAMDRKNQLAGPLSLSTAAPIHAVNGRIGPKMDPRGSPLWFGA